MTREELIEKMVFAGIKREDAEKCVMTKEEIFGMRCNASMQKLAEAQVKLFLFKFRRSTYGRSK